MSEAFRKRLLYVVIIAYMTALFVLAVIPLELPDIGLDPKKLLHHFIAFGILGGLLGKGVTRTSMALGVGIIYGILLELIQVFLPYRLFDPWDLLANVVGASAGTFIITRLLRKKQ